jgi:succinyl-CoA synthetase beta subunit
VKLHEFQAKDVLRRHGVPLLAGGCATDADEAVAVAAGLSAPVVVVKAQIHAGGRGKGRFVGQVDAAALDAAARGDDAPGKGGVRLCRGSDEVAAAARSMLGATLVTKQTGRAGRVVRTVFVEAGCAIARELYLSVLLDRSNNRILFLASDAGGVNIEDVAEHEPHRIHKAWVHPAVGFGAWQGRRLAAALGLTGKEVGAFVTFCQRLYTAYMESDASMLEVNPLVVTADGAVIALDAKMTLDDNALYRHPDLAALRDEHEEDPAEIEAGRWNLSYVALDGSIGCLVNGAGLAMATMDIIQHKGRKPANFLDVGGGANQEQVTAAFRIITKDPAVNGILVNIFGGIMKCDVIAAGVIAAAREVGLKVPLVVRLAGTNVEAGRALLAQSGLAITAVETLDEAGDAIVAAVGV